MEFFKEYELEKNTNLKIEISINLMDNFYSENYTNEINVNYSIIHEFLNIFHLNFLYFFKHINFNT